MAVWYWSVAILFWQLSIVNGQSKRCGFAKKRLRHPSLPFDSLPNPTRTICRRVRTYARSVTWQPKEKRLTIFNEYGALSHARFALEGAPLLSFPSSLICDPAESLFNRSRFETSKCKQRHKWYFALKRASFSDAFIAKTIDLFG